MPELRTAYHEAGHCVMAVMLGGIVEVATVDPDWDDRQQRSGDVRVRWDSSHNWRSQALTALAGPAAEAVFLQQPLHPGFVEAWSEDWQNAWDLSQSASKDEKKRLALLERVSAELYQIFNQDTVWNAVAAIADELLAHDTIYQEEIEETVRFWID